MPIGVELSGLQDRYSQGSEAGAPWNWTLCTPADTLIAYPGNKNTLVYLKSRWYRPITALPWRRTFCLRMP